MSPASTASVTSTWCVCDLCARASACAWACVSRENPGFAPCAQKDCWFPPGKTVFKAHSMPGRVSWRRPSANAEQRELGFTIGDIARFNTWKLANPYREFQKARRRLLCWPAVAH